MPYMSTHRMAAIMDLSVVSAAPLPITKADGDTYVGDKDTQTVYSNPPVICQWALVSSSTHHHHPFVLIAAQTP
jgi:hypothetical protein